MRCVTNQLSVNVLKRLYDDKNILIENTNVKDIDVLSLIKVGYRININLTQESNGLMKPLNKRDNDILFTFLNLDTTNFSLRDRMVFNIYVFNTFIIETWEATEEEIEVLRKTLEVL
jgi:hypothetical protein